MEGRARSVVIGEYHRSYERFAAAVVDYAELIEDITAVNLQAGIGGGLRRSGTSLGKYGAHAGGAHVMEQVFDIPNGAATSKAEHRDQHDDLRQ